MVTLLSGGVGQAYEEIPVGEGRFGLTGNPGNLGKP
jgi:hypothetical protein